VGAGKVSVLKFGFELPVCTITGAGFVVVVVVAVGGAVAGTGVVVLINPEF
jgi:hypothetical protein